MLKSWKKYDKISKNYQYFTCHRYIIDISKKKRYLTCRYDIGTISKIFLIYLPISTVIVKIKT